MKLGISSYSFGWAVGVAGHPPARPMTEHDLLDIAARDGVSVLQIGDNLPLHTFSETRLSEFAKAAASRHIQIEVGARRLVPERVAKYAIIARTLGARLIRFVIDD